ncbi:hypothetical protein, partial [Escherichia coli]|uniref:hypothetical protein n=1 Tax=Escherichia coli TaxID=562 RepID=UPI0013C330A5
NYVIASSQYNTASTNLQTARDNVTAKKSALDTDDIRLAIDEIESEGNDSLNAFLLNLGENATEKLMKISSL